MKLAFSVLTKFTQLAHKRTYVTNFVGSILWYNDLRQGEMYSIPCTNKETSDKSAHLNSFVKLLIVTFRNKHNWRPSGKCESSGACAMLYYCWFLLHARHPFSFAFTLVCVLMLFVAPDLCFVILTILLLYISDW